MQPSLNRGPFTLTRPASDVLIVIASAIGPILYITRAVQMTGNLGFPLDDAWIYQVYARNLAESGQWAFVPGVPSTGSTSILWTLLITPAYILHLNAVVWTMVIGWASLAAAALGTSRLFKSISLRAATLVGLAVALEWHLAWAAASGMETMFFAALLVWFWLWASDEGRPVSWKSGLSLGLWAGILILARPDGLLPAIIVGVYTILKSSPLNSKISWSATALIGFLFLIVPYAVLNLSISGSLWPNTFYAKQTEYAILWQLPFIQRFWEQLQQPWLGAQVLTVPALIFDRFRRAKHKESTSSEWLPIWWIIAHAVLFTLRLPVTYQHGRYAIPLIPIAVALGIQALARILRPYAQSLFARVGSRGWAITLALLVPIILIALGMPAYASDIRFIEVEMRSAARWVDAHTEPTDILAIHDIGAIGYESPHQLVDLAGLISPSVIPFMADDSALANFIIAEDASYLIVFPRWSLAYNRLVSRPEFCKVWSADSEPDYVAYAPHQGPMTIYKISLSGHCK